MATHHRETAFPFVQGPEAFLACQHDIRNVPPVGFIQGLLDERRGDSLSAGVGVNDDIVNLPIDRRGDEQHAFDQGSLWILYHGYVPDRLPDSEELMPCAKLGGNEVPQCPAGGFVSEERLHAEERYRMRDGTFSSGLTDIVQLRFSRHVNAVPNDVLRPKIAYGSGVGQVYVAGVSYFFPVLSLKNLRNSSLSRMSPTE